MRIAVTGAAGYLGSWLLPALEEAGHEVWGFDRQDPPGGETRGWTVGDLAEPWVTRRLVEIGPEVVVHLAARTGRLFGEDDRADSIRSNVEATVAVAASASEAGARMVYASSSEIYGDTRDLCTEDGPYALPHNLYGLSKRWGEEACRLYAPAGLTVWRICMPYGPGSKVGGRGFNALHSFLWRAHHRMPIEVHRSGSRSWTWVGDTVAGMLATLNRPGVWNIGGDHDHRPMREVAKLACEITGASWSLIRVVDPPAAQTVVKRLSAAKLEALGWAPSMPLEVGMKATYEWVARHDRDGVLDGPNR